MVCFCLNKSIYGSMGDAKLVQAPIAIGLVLSLTDDCNLQNVTDYMQVVRSVQYLSFTLHDITFVVNKLP